jgi:hypothetical protein
LTLMAMRKRVVRVAVAVMNLTLQQTQRSMRTSIKSTYIYFLFIKKNTFNRKLREKQKQEYENLKIEFLNFK